jgi:hypothetical protein
MVFAGKIEGLGAAFDGYSSIRVADYQRNYDWGPREIDDLFSDLEQATSRDEPHFLGSLIIQEGSRSNECELVDGQQRMTTIFLLMARLRDEAQKLSTNTIKAKSTSDRDIYVTQPIENFLYGTQSQGTKPRFTSNALLGELCDRALSPKPDPDYHREIRLRSEDADREATLAFRKAYWYIRKTLAEKLERSKSEEDRLRSIHAYSRGIRELLRVLPITTGDLEESLSVFMTTNDRGLPLGVFDLVRGQILKARSQKLKSDSARREMFVKTLAEWEAILENVEGSKPDQFVRHHLLSVRDEKITLKAVPTTAAEIIDPKRGRSEQRAEDLWEGIQSASVVYDRLLRPQGNSAIRYRLEALRLIADSYRIIGLQLFRDDLNFSSTQLEKCTHALFAAVFSWNISGGNAQELETNLQGIAKQVRKGKPASEVEESLTHLIPASVDVKAFLEEGVSQSWTRAIFLAIESELSGRADYLDARALHIEHIAPQKSTDSWRALIDSPAQPYEKQINEIGNLTILDSGLNMQIKQSDFTVKKREYDKSRSNVSSDLARLKNWNQEMISLRTDWVCECVESLIMPTPRKIDLFSDWLRKTVG